MDVALKKDRKRARSRSSSRSSSPPSTNKKPNLNQELPSLHELIQLPKLGQVRLARIYNIVSGGNKTKRGKRLHAAGVTKKDYDEALQAVQETHKIFLIKKRQARAQNKRDIENFYDGKTDAKIEYDRMNEHAIYARDIPILMKVDNLAGFGSSRQYYVRIFFKVSSVKTFQQFQDENELEKKEKQDMPKSTQHILKKANLEIISKGGPSQSKLWLLRDDLCNKMKFLMPNTIQNSKSPMLGRRWLSQDLDKLSEILSYQAKRLSQFVFCLQHKNAPEQDLYSYSYNNFLDQILTPIYKSKLAIAKKLPLCILNPDPQRHSRTPSNIQKWLRLEKISIVGEWEKDTKDKVSDSKDNKDHDKDSGKDAKYQHFSAPLSVEQQYKLVQEYKALRTLVIEKKLTKIAADIPEPIWTWFAQVVPIKNGKKRHRIVACVSEIIETGYDSGDNGIDFMYNMYNSFKSPFVEAPDDFISLLKALSGNYLSDELQPELILKRHIARHGNGLARAVPSDSFNLFNAFYVIDDRVFELLQGFVDNGKHVSHPPNFQPDIARIVWQYLVCNSVFLVLQ